MPLSQQHVLRKWDQKVKAQKLSTLVLFQRRPYTAHLPGIQRYEFRLSAPREDGYATAVFTVGIDADGQALAPVSENLDNAVVYKNVETYRLILFDLNRPSLRAAC